MESEMMCRASRLPSPVNFQISHHPLTMRRVVNLVIAMERLKNSVAQTLLSPDFRDESLLSIMLESIVEEKVVSDLFAAKPQFTKMGDHEPKPYYNVTDSQKRNLVLADGSMKLHAVMLQGGSTSRKVQLNMSTYRPPLPSAEARPVALGIKGTDYYLCCHNDGNEPSLHIETVSNKDQLTNISTDSDMVRFIFYKHDTGLNLSSLRSARFPEWYISTAEQDNVPVQMCAEASSYSTFSFQVQRQN
ncbi:interleukin-1 beta-like [Eucyclogobius newberryi]|uniref:interleukin-1 beta-like n=1 Tax=Eucyclogobius newberryi TaxID=166745 RepID=UPI003B5950E0